MPISGGIDESLILLGMSATGDRKGLAMRLALELFRP
jgi:hypothetical protein